MDESESKKDRKQILFMIRDSVMQSPKSMYELAKELHSNWDTIKNNVLLLKDLGIVDIQDQKVFYTQKNISLNEEYFAGLPVSDDMRRKVYAIAQQFADEWKKKSDSKICNTILQKAIVEIADAFPELDIPRGWYLYGKVVLVKLNESILKGKVYHYNFSQELDIKKFNAKITEMVDHLQKMKVKDVVEEQYSNHHSQMYLAKNSIEKMLYGSDIMKNKDLLSKNLYELVFLFKLDHDNEFSEDVFNIVKDGITFMIEILTGRISLNNKSMQSVLIDLFKSVWKILATYNLYNTMEGNTGYDKLVVDSLLVEKTSFYKMEFIDQCNALGL